MPSVRYLLRFCSLWCHHGTYLKTLVWAFLQCSVALTYAAARPPSFGVQQHIVLAIAVLITLLCFLACWPSRTESVRGILLIVTHCLTLFIHGLFFWKQTDANSTISGTLVDLTPCLIPALQLASAQMPVPMIYQTLPMLSSVVIPLCVYPSEYLAPIPMIILFWAMVLTVLNASGMASKQPQAMAGCARCSKFPASGFTPSLSSGSSMAAGSPISMDLQSVGSMQASSSLLKPSWTARGGATGGIVGKPNASLYPSAMLHPFGGCCGSFSSGEIPALSANNPLGLERKNSDDFPLPVDLLMGDIAGNGSSASERGRGFEIQMNGGFPQMSRGGPPATSKVNGQLISQRSATKAVEVLCRNVLKEQLESASEETLLNASLNASFNAPASCGSNLPVPINNFFPLATASQQQQQQQALRFSTDLKPNRSVNLLDAKLACSTAPSPPPTELPTTKGIMREESEIRRSFEEEKIDTVLSFDPNTEASSEHLQVPTNLNPLPKRRPSDLRVRFEVQPSLPVASSDSAHSVGEPSEPSSRQPSLADTILIPPFAPSVTPHAPSDRRETKMDVQILTSLCQDVRAPLSMAISALAILADEKVELSPTERADLVHTALASVHSGLSLVTNILDYDSIQSKSFNGPSSVLVGQKPVNVRRVTVRLFQTSLEAIRCKHTEIIFDISPTFPTVILCDRGLFQKVLVLLSEIVLEESGAPTSPTTASGAPRHALYIGLDWEDTKHQVTGTVAAITPGDGSAIKNECQSNHKPRVSVASFRKDTTSLRLSIGAEFLAKMGGSLNAMRHLDDPLLNAALSQDSNLAFKFMFPSTVVKSVSTAVDLAARIIDDCPLRNRATRNMMLYAGITVLHHHLPTAASQVVKPSTEGPPMLAFVSSTLSTLPATVSTLQALNLPVCLVVPNHQTQSLADNPQHLGIPNADAILRTPIDIVELREVIRKFTGSILLSDSSRSSAQPQPAPQAHRT